MHATRDATVAGAEAYEQYIDETVHGAERVVIDQHLAGRRVLDLGCGTGRLFGELSGASSVVGLDLSGPALAMLRGRPGLAGARLTRADARRLPFSSASFGGVVFAYNGLDMLIGPGDRIAALREIDRVLEPGGWFVFSSHNPLGELLSPWGMRSPKTWGYRIRYLLTGQIFRRVFHDRSRREIHQAPPREVIRQVETETTMHHDALVDLTGRVHSRALVALFSAWPYYVFRKGLVTPGSVASSP